MPRTKKTAPRRRGRGGHNNGRPMPNLETSFIPFASTSGMNERNGYSLQSEALNSQRRQSFWSSDQRLRHTKVNFVSAESSEPSNLRAPEAALADLALDDLPKSLRDNTVQIDALLQQDFPQTGQDDTSCIMQEERAEPFVIDTQGDRSIITGLPLPQICSASSTSSDSSEEVIVFAGRDSAGKAISKIPPIRKIITDPYDARIGMVEKKIHEQELLLVATTGNRKSSSPKLQEMSCHLAGLQDDTEIDVIPRYPQHSRQLMVEGSEASNQDGCPRKRTRPHRRGPKRASEQALIDDYIANMEENELDPNVSFNQRDMGSGDTDAWQETDTSSSDPSKHPLENEWDRSDLCDLDGLSTSDEVFGSVQAILSKRNRKSGLQYLVVWEDHSMDEARWVSISNLTDPVSMKLIDQFEAEEKFVVEIFDGSVSDSDRDPPIDKDIDSDGDVVICVAPNQIRRGVRGARGAKRPRGEFPTATVLADACDSFDVTDFERPSLNKKPKGRKGKSAFDLSDSELEASMQMAWDNDRNKKKKKKKERQELRAHGFLGTKRNKLDLKEEYKEGMGLQAVKEEIKKFLKGDATTLALPPMDKADRKVVHELANAFNLKSKSAGNGRNRFPVLYRTSQTSSYVESKFNAVEASLTRRYFPRMDLRSKNSWTAMPKRSGRGGSASAAVSYRDGDIVGGSAPELGIENKGRAMLEKMGWSTGTALGALNNKGILQPVSHVVKTTKAGLG